MNRRRVKKILRLILPPAVILSYCAGVYAFCLLSQDPDTYQVACGGGASLTQEDHENIRKTQEGGASALRYALWKKTESVEVENPRWGRRSTVSEWSVRGDMELLFRGMVKLAEQDLQGCYLDAETARELFGTTAVVGSEICCQGKRLTIRGILEHENGLLALRPGEKETTDHLTFGGASPSEVRNFLLRYGIPGTAVNTFFLREILQILLMLFPLSLALFLFRSLKGSQAEGVRWIVLLFMLYLLLRQIQIPETLIPDKWSDFEFWKEQWTLGRENLYAYMRQEKTGRELAQIACFFRGVLCALFPVFVWQIPIREGCR